MGEPLMKNKKTVEAIVAPPPPHMVGDGFRVHNFFPNSGTIHKKRMSPFFLLDYNSKVEFTPREIPRGVSVHPHRGFETVTIAYHGKVAHHDSAGNSGVIGEGDVQWMTAASGLLHKEYHEKEFSKTGGLFQMVQLWVNLPAKDKKVKPKYQEITNSAMGKAYLNDKTSFIEVIAGEYGGEKGPACTFTPMQVYNAKLNKGVSAEFNLPANFNTGLLVIEGTIKVNARPDDPVGRDKEVLNDNFVLLKNDGEQFTIEATTDAVVLILSGEPIEEPIAAYGPFLMNTWQEVEEAINDVNAGKFGVLQD